MKTITGQNLHFKTYDEFDKFCENKNITECRIDIDEKLTDEERVERYGGFIFNLNNQQS